MREFAPLGATYAFNYGSVSAGAPPPVRAYNIAQGRAGGPALFSAC